MTNSLELLLLINACDNPFDERLLLEALRINFYGSRLHNLRFLYDGFITLFSYEKLEIKGA